MHGPRIETDRLILRPTAAEDFDAWAECMADPEVNRFLGGPQPRALAWRNFMTMAGCWSINGFGMFSVIERSSGRWVGRLGPWQPEGWPGHEIGWGLMRETWGKGYATEGAAASMDWAFAHLGWSQVIHSIAPVNHASIGVAKKLGSTLQGPGTLPPPSEDSIVDLWGQTREQWYARPSLIHPFREESFLSRSESSMLTVYGLRSSGNCYKLQQMLDLLGLPYRWVDTDSANGATRTPEFLALNPNGKVPLLVLEDGRRLSESNAILCYLAEGTPYLPADAWERARTLQWMFFEQYSHEPYVAVARFVRKWLPEGHTRYAELPNLVERGTKALDVMEDHLSREAFFSGGAFGVADIALFAYTHCAADGGFDMSRWPHIAAWLERVRAQPGFSPMAA